MRFLGTKEGGQEEAGVWMRDRVVHEIHGNVLCLDISANVLAVTLC